MLSQGKPGGSRIVTMSAAPSQHAIATRRSLASALDGHGDDRTMADGPGGRHLRSPQPTTVSVPEAGQVSAPSAGL
jgi:hypothetical protein